ncbi:MAG: TonB-dependent receptor, partial [Myxococcota bacterium]
MVRKFGTLECLFSEVPVHRFACIGLVGLCLGVSTLAQAQPDPTSMPAASTAPSAREASVVPPRLEHVPEAAYPAEAHEQGIEGAVELELVVSETGTVADILAVRGPQILRPPAIDAARNIRFSPALLNGVPIPVQIAYTFRFVAPGPMLPSATSTSAVADASNASTADASDASGTPGSPDAPESPNSADASESSESLFRARGPDVVVLTRRYTRSATDFRIRLDLENLAASGGTSGAAALRAAPGVYISNHSGQGKGHQIFLRGFDAVHGQDVAVSAGGIPVNDVSNIHAQGYVDLHFLIPEVIKQMRVLEGPFDPAQGDFAVAGSIEFDLGLPKTGVWTRFSIGQFGLVRSLVAWRPEEADDETFVAAEVAQADGFGPARAWGRVNVMGQWNFDLGDLEGSILASSYAGRFDSAGAVRLDDFEAGRVDFFDTYDPFQGGASGRHQVRLRLSKESDTQRTEGSVFGVLRNFRLRSNFTGTFVDDRGDRIEQEQSAVIVGGSAMHRMRLLDSIDLGVGVTVRHDEIEQSQTRLRTADREPYLNEADNQLSITDIGVYGDLNVRLASWLQVRGGLRVEALSYRIDQRLANEGAGERREAFGYHFAPRVTLDARVSDMWRVFASYGNGFRSPQAVSLQQGEQTPLTTVNAGELGTRIIAWPGFEIIAAGFVTHVEEDLLFDHATGSALISGPTLRLGGIGRAQIVLGGGLHASASVTYTRATKPDTGDQVPFVPPLVVQGDIHYVAQLGVVV